MISGRWGQAGGGRFAQPVPLLWVLQPQMLGRRRVRGCRVLVALRVGQTYVWWKARAAQAQAPEAGGS